MVRQLGCSFKYSFDGAAMVVLGGSGGSGSSGTAAATTVDTAVPQVPPRLSNSTTAVFQLMALVNGTVTLLPNATSGNSTVQVRVDGNSTWTDVRKMSGFSSTTNTSTLTLTGTAQVERGGW